MQNRSKQNENSNNKEVNNIESKTPQKPDVNVKRHKNKERFLHKQKKEEQVKNIPQAEQKLNIPSSPEKENLATKNLPYNEINEDKYNKVGKDNRPAVQEGGKNDIIYKKKKGFRSEDKPFKEKREVTERQVEPQVETHEPTTTIETRNEGKKQNKYNRYSSERSENEYKPVVSEELLKKIESKTDSISLSENKTYFIERSELSEKTQRVLNGPRFIAVKILNRFDRSDSYVDILLTNELNKNDLSNLDKSLLTEIVNGVIRWRSKLDWVLNGFYHGEFQKCLNLVKNAMRVGLYQMLFLNKIPHSAAIDDSVEIVKHIQGDKAAGLVNGVLRNIARNIANIRYPNQNDDYPHYLGVIHSHPKWLTKRWLERYGNEQTIELLEANNKISAIPIRINNTKYSIGELVELFESKEIPYCKHPNLDNIIWLKQNINVTQSELFKNGKITIQDPSASLIPRLCNPQENDFILDLCSAPGGKTVYIAELMNNKGEILALDKFGNRLNLVKQTAERMGFSIIETKESDAVSFKLDKKHLADIVLVDAPCTGLGTLTKKPEIKWKREIEDVFQMAKLQFEILSNAANLVKIGGVLVYSTCTIEPEENMRIIEKFLSENPNFTLDDAKNYIPEEFTKDGYIQTFPHIHHIDGAFGARLIRKS